jgi:hypothetical protein
LERREAFGACDALSLVGVLAALAATQAMGTLLYVSPQRIR